jgi:hypothetical protein
MAKNEELNSLSPKYSEVHTEIVRTIVDQAKLLFEVCESPSDFCIQVMDEDHIIFGGLNRVKWTAKTGFVALRRSCTTRFLENWDNARANCQSTCESME